MVRTRGFTKFSDTQMLKNYRGIDACPGRIALALILAFVSLRVVIVIVVFRILQLANIQVLEEILKHR